MRLLGDELRKASNNVEFANVFRIIKPSAWRNLPDDVLIRMENIIIEECKKDIWISILMRPKEL